MGSEYCVFVSCFWGGIPLLKITSQKEVERVVSLRNIPYLCRVFSHFFQRERAAW